MINSKEAAMRIESFYSRCLEEREFKLQDKENHEFDIKIQAVIKIQAFIRGYLSCKRLLTRWTEEIREQIRSRKRKYREDVKKRNVQLKKMQDDAVLRLTTVKKQVKTEVSRKNSPKRTNKQIDDYLKVLQAREKKKEEIAKEQQVRMEKLKNMQKRTVTGTSPRLLVPRKHIINHSPVDEVEDHSKPSWKSHVTPKSTISPKNISNSLVNIDNGNNCATFVTSPITHEPSPPKGSKRNTSRNTRRTTVTPSDNGDKITASTNDSVSTREEDIEKQKTKEVKQRNKTPTYSKPNASRKTEKKLTPHASTPVIAKTSSKKLKFSQNGVLCSTSKLSNETNKNIILLSEKVEEEILRSSLLAKPLPKLMPNMKEKELVKLAKLRSLILDTYNPLTGLFGGADNDKISIRLQYAETYAVNRLVKEREKERERQRLRQEYMQEMQEKAIQQRKKVKALHTALLNRAKYEEELQKKKYLIELKLNGNNNRQKFALSGSKKKRNVATGDESTVTTSKSDPTGYSGAPTSVVDSGSHSPPPPVAENIRQIQLEDINDSTQHAEEVNKTLQQQVSGMYNGFKRRFSLVKV
jgi:hypothetical protein